MLGFSPPPSPAEQMHMEQSTPARQMNMEASNMEASTPAQQMNMGGPPSPLSGPRWLPSPNIRAALRKVHPMKSINILKATPSKGLQYVKATVKKFKAQSARTEAKKLSAFLHAASFGNHSNAATILSVTVDGIKGMQEVLVERFGGNTLDASIINSVSKLLKRI